MNLTKMLGIIQPVDPVMVHLKSGDTIRGLLVDRQREWLTLRAASVGSVRPQDGAEMWTKAVGDVVIPVDNIDWYQAALPITVIE